MEEEKHHKIPLIKKIAFALGQVGWSLAVFGFTELIYFFYLPPENGKPLFKSYVYQGALLKIFTIVGILSAVGYIISAFMEPIVGSWSDRSTFKFGKRKTFMAFAIFPFAFLSAAVFFPIVDGLHFLNIIWLSVLVLLAFTVMCFYTTPYNAMINEITHNEKERLHIIMMLSIAYALGIGIGQTINIILSAFESSYSHESVFQISVAIYASISLVLMAMPVLFVEDNSGKNINQNEIQYDAKHTGIFDSLNEVWSNKNFRIFAIVELIYWFPQKIFTIAVPYFVSALLRLDNVYTAIVLYSVGIVSLLFYPIIDKLVERYGKRKIILSAFVGLIISFGFTATIGLYKLPPILFVIIYVIINTYPMAVLGILPMALTGDNAEDDFKRTGIAKNASYYALKTFMMKMGIAITSLIFPSLLLLGKSPENPLGVRLVAIACMVANLIAFLLMRKYKDV